MSFPHHMSDFYACKSSHDLQETLTGLIHQRQFAVLADENTAGHCLPLLEEALGPMLARSIIVSPGEPCKHISVAGEVWKQMLNFNLSRNDVLINVGGGSITDLGGFCAALFKRGIGFIHVPTSLLGMVDAAIGGKTGINFGGLKNMIGTFTRAEAVLLWPGMLSTLPPEEMLNGWAEIIKHALVLDAVLWDEILAMDRLETPEAEMIFRSASLKQTVINKDFHEAGTRKILNFGHTVAHALESTSLEQNQPPPHGLAVAAGIIIESHVCMQLELLSAEHLYAISRFIQQHFPAVTTEPGDDRRLVEAMKKDKKNRNREILIAGIRYPGAALTEIPVSSNNFQQALEFYRDL